MSACYRDRVKHGQAGRDLDVPSDAMRTMGLDAERDMRPQILATIAFAPLDAAMFSWFGNRSSEEVGHLLDEALRAFVRERDAMCAAISKTGKARKAAIK